MCCKAEGSIHDIGTIFDNQIKLFVGISSGNFMELDLFHGIHLGCSMESEVDMPPFHMEFIIP